MPAHLQLCTVPGQQHVQPAAVLPATRAQQSARLPNPLAPPRERLSLSTQLPHMARGSSIVNSTSVTAYQGSPSLLAYRQAALHSVVPRKRAVRLKACAFFLSAQRTPRRASHVCALWARGALRHHGLAGCFWPRCQLTICFLRRSNLHSEQLNQGSHRLLHPLPGRPAGAQGKPSRMHLCAPAFPTGQLAHPAGDALLHEEVHMHQRVPACCMHACVSVPAENAASA